MTVRVQFDGKHFVPQRSIDLPVGYEAEVELPDNTAGPAPADDEPFLMKLAKLAEEFPHNPDAPVDGAAQHDHYLYGTPKRP
jgi:hypothetical protein